MSSLSIHGVDVHVEGDGAETIVMIHGWPDTYRLWDATVDALEARYRCVRFTIPGFDPARAPRAYTFDELMAFLDEVIVSTSPGKKAVLLLHDWGCFFGYQFYARHPEQVSRIVGVDIGDPRWTRRILHTREKLIMVAYQTWNALAWKIGGPIGTWMTRSLARLGNCPSDRAPMSFRMGYPYWLLWFGGKDSYRHHVRRFEPTCPMLFVYGVRKPMRFHAKEWADALAAQPGNRVVEFDTGHWVMSDAPQRFNQVVSEWLTEAAARG
jgi:pimeloyl-ACP methyl ester carboxylesterase